MPASVPLSILDLTHVAPAESPADALARTVRLARTADAAGFTRLWFSEHHNMRNLASAATALVIQHVASQTAHIRVGAGGVMLPNHSPLVVAEQYGTLETLYPGRIDLGLGRAPGTDGDTVRALRRDGSESMRFAEDVLELHGYLHDDPAAARVVRAYPGVGTRVPLYVLGSSLYGARLAAQLGLPYAFASHFAPQMLGEAAAVYRQQFDASGPLAAVGARPHLMAAVNVIAADDEDRAHDLYERAKDRWLQGALGRNRDLIAHELAEIRRSPAGAQVLRMLDRTLVGTGPQVVSGLDALADEIAADELIVVNAATEEQHQHRALELLAPNVGTGDPLLASAAVN